MAHPAPNSYYIPDSIYTSLVSGTISHLEFDDDHHIATPIYLDGSYGASFSTRVTREMLDKERELWSERCIAGGGMIFTAIVRATVSEEDMKSFRGVVWNSGA